MAPKVFEKAAGTFRCEQMPLLLGGASVLKAEGSPLRPLRDLLATRFGGTAHVRPVEKRLPAEPFVLAGFPQDHPSLRDLVASLKPQLPRGGLGEEGWALEVAPGRVLLAAERPAGLLRGAAALAERAGGESGVLTLDAGRTADWPALRWRGIHVMVNGRADLPALETLLTRDASALRVNRVILEVNYQFAYRSHPEVAAPAGLTPDDARHIVDLARGRGVEIIPMLNCLGHQSWAKDTGRLLAVHPEFDETPELPPDNPGIYCRSWCPSNPAVARFVGDLIDELVEAFSARSFHCGMDEVFILGQCPRCKGQANADLFAKAVGDLHAHLAKRKVGMMIWGDRLLDAKATGYGEWEASANDTAPAISRIPKDIVVCDWHYGTPADFPSVAHFQQQGFTVWPAGWNSAQNARLLASCALRNQGERMAGYLATTWVGVGPLARGLAGDADALKDKGIAGVVAGLRTGLRMAWEGKG